MQTTDLNLCASSSCQLLKVERKLLVNFSAIRFSSTAFIASATLLMVRLAEYNTQSVC